MPIATVVVGRGEKNLEIIGNFFETEEVFPVFYLILD